MAAVVLSLSLVGCSEDPVPNPLPPLPTASPSPSVVAAPSPPPEALAETPQGAAAFAEYYFDVVNAASLSANASPLRNLSSSDCGGCQNIIQAIEAPATPGETVDGGLFDVLFAEAPPAQEGVVPVELQYVITALRVLGDQGEVLRSKPRSEPISAQLFLQRTAGTWSVRSFVNTEG